jgi:hypothetical protein
MKEDREKKVAYDAHMSVDGGYSLVRTWLEQLACDEFFEG